MKPVKRKSHGKSTHRKKNKLSQRLPELPVKYSQSTQTDAIKMNTLNHVPQVRKFSRPRATMVQQRKWLECKPEQSEMDVDKRNTRNKSCQTVKIGFVYTATNKMDSLKATMLKRRKISIDADRSRLRKLMDDINADPPPSWHLASLMWLDVDILDRRIEEFEREEFGQEFKMNATI